MRSWRSSRPSCSSRARTLLAAASLTLMPSGRTWVSVLVSTCSVIGVLPNSTVFWACHGARVRRQTGQWSHIADYSQVPCAGPLRRPPETPLSRESSGPGPGDPLSEGGEASGGVGEAGLLPHQVDHRVGLLHPQGARLPGPHQDLAGQCDARLERLRGDRGHAVRDLPRAGGEVEGPLAGDDQVGAAGPLAEPYRGGHHVDAGGPRGTEEQQREAEAAGRSGAL